jgi:23S rRNA (cytidine1920-2'-O)/16S rRNA (cytidine1409-2'-O)-methyltransferase
MDNGAARARLDMALVARGLAPSRAQAQAMIRAGGVRVNGALCRKAALLCGADDAITAEGGLPFVSRGGLKLEAALRAFDIDVAGRVCLDLGASTGGFTHCLLSRGAASVFAVDVGTAQLADSLRLDLRVTVLERTDARAVTPDILGGPADFICCDLSFISLSHIFPVLPPLLLPEGHAVALVKPQFEAGPGAVGKGGVVRDPAVHIRVLHAVLAAAESHGLYPWGLIPSPVAGGDGNIEFLLHMRLAPPESGGVIDIPAIVSIVHPKGGRG